MTGRSSRGCSLALVLVAGGFAAQPLAAQADWLQADIATLHAAMRAGELTSAALVASCLRRIAAEDGDARAIVRLVDGCEAAARAADEHLRATGKLLGPLHGIPVAVKDNIDVAGTPTSLGLTALQDALPPADATVVARIRAAGGIVLAKTNLATLARSSRDTVSEVRGRTPSPYSADHVIAGSSGGTAAAVALGFATLGIATDTGTSIRAPAMHASLVGIRPSFGAVPLTGVAPLYRGRDTVGPIARTVADAAVLLQVATGQPATDFKAGSPSPSLRGVRFGVLRFLAAPSRSDAEVLVAFARALADLQTLGAELVELDALVGDGDLHHIPVDRDGFVIDLGTFLRTRLPPHDRHLAADLLAAGPRRSGAVRFDPMAVAARTQRLRAAIAATFARERLTAFVYPTWSRAPLRADAGRQENGDNSGFVCPPAGVPGITVPMGFTVAGLPLGIEFAGQRGDEAKLVELAAAYERATHHRRPPPRSSR